MKVFIVTPEPPDGTLGNSITAQRWAGILRSLGHDVRISRDWIADDVDMLVALHALRSHPAIRRFKDSHPARPLILGLTGTDLYRDLRRSASARESLVLADRIVALQESAPAELLPEIAAKTQVIYQSAIPPARRTEPAEDRFEVCVLSHLRDVKDPLRAAMAARLLPSGSKIHVIHAGKAIEAQWLVRTRAEEAANSRYTWIGEQSHEESMQLLARSRVLVLSSLMEGGSNAVAEAVVCGVPVLCSNISGNAGMLGAEYPGFFRAQDSAALAGLLHRAETDPSFLSTLKAVIHRLRPRFSPEREQASWKSLMDEWTK